MEAVSPQPDRDFCGFSRQQSETVTTRKNPDAARTISEQPDAAQKISRTFTPNFPGGGTPKKTHL